MKHARTLAALAAAAVLSLGAAGPVHATPPDGEPCAKQEQQVAKAEEALAKVRAVFDKQRTRIEKLRDKLEAATPEEQAKLQAKLDKTLAKKQHVKKDKVAQVKRLAKAEERLAACSTPDA